MMAAQTTEEVMELNEIKALYPEGPGYSDEVGRFVGRNGATYRAWRNGTAQRIDPDCNVRGYGEESAEIFRWRE